MTARTAYPELGLAPPTACVGYRPPHRPRPLRLVWHHVLPQACGGKTTVVNLVGLCDTCHYATHALLHRLRLARPDPAAGLSGLRRADGTAEQRELAWRGYVAAVAAGTVDRIPDEG